MDCRVNITVEVDQVGNGLAITTPVPIQLIYSKKHWQAVCENPHVQTLTFATMEEAIIAGARQAAAEAQAAVVERPLILARITPENLPREMFQT